MDEDEALEDLEPASEVVIISYGRGSPCQETFEDCFGSKAAGVSTSYILAIRKPGKSPNNLPARDRGRF
jgi:hypothetical protein